MNITLKNIANLQVVKRLNTYPAFIVRLHLVYTVFEPPERIDFTFVNQSIIAKDAEGLVVGNPSPIDITTSN